MSDFRAECLSAFSEGNKAKSIFDNPYWICYPKDSTDIDESKARWWVDGYVEKLRKENEKTL